MTRRREKVAAALIAALFLVVLDDDARAHPGSTFQVIVSDILMPRCFNACHGSNDNGGMAVVPTNPVNPADQEQAWYSVLVNRTPANGAAAGFGKLRVDPGRPWNSFIVDKLSADLKSGEPFPMPKGSLGYIFDCPGGVEKIKAWILAGAPHTGIVEGDFSPTQVVCERSQPALSAPLPPGDGVQLAGSAFTAERPALDGEKLTRVALGIAPTCDNTQQPCFITGVDIVASAGTEYVVVSRAGESVPIAVARGAQLSLALPSGVGVPVAAGQELEIRQRIRNEYWIGPAPYRNITTGSVFVNLHLASDARPAEPFLNDGGSQALFVPPQSYGATGGLWLPSSSATHAMAGVWSDRHALRADLVDPAGAPADPSAVASGYVATSGGPLAYSCVHANGWVPNDLGAASANGTLNGITGPVDMSSPLKWGCEATANVPPGSLALAGGVAAKTCARSSESANDCSAEPGTHKCEPANLVFGMGADDGRCTLVGLAW
jgi:hypothetical protein